MELGYDQSQIARSLGMSRNQYSNYETMKESPLYVNRSWKPWALKMADFFDCELKELFPDYTRKFKNPIEDETDEPVQIFMSEHSQRMAIDPEELIDVRFRQKFMPKQIRFALNTISSRQRLALILRYGLLDKVNKKMKMHTLEEIGKMMEITRERVSQVLLRALRNLRKTSGKFLRSFQLDEI